MLEKKIILSIISFPRLKLIGQKKLHRSLYFPCVKNSSIRGKRGGDGEEVFRSKQLEKSGLARGIKHPKNQPRVVFRNNCSQNLENVSKR